MSDIEIITDGGRLCRWPAAEKLRIVEGAEDHKRPQWGVFPTNMYDGESIAAVARRNGEAPDLLYRWRKLMLEGGSIAMAADDSVTGNKTVRDMGARIRELERQIGRKTMEVEILKEALDISWSKKNRPCLRSRSTVTICHEVRCRCFGRLSI